MIEHLLPGRSEIYDRSQRVQHPPYRAGGVRRLRDAACVARPAVGVERNRNRAVGHCCQAREAAVVQPARRRVAGERVKVYANGWSSGTAGRSSKNLERALKVKEIGLHRALKWDPFPGPWRNFIHREDEDHVVRYVEDARDAGAGIRAAGGEVHRRLAPIHAIRIGQAPRRSSTSDGTRNRASATTSNWWRRCGGALPGVPIVTGEAIYSKEAFAQALAARAWLSSIRTSAIAAGLSADAARHRRDGAAARRGGGAAQLWSTLVGAGGDGAAFGDDPELLDRRDSSST